MPLREFPMSNLDKEFILGALTQKLRVDDRGVYDYRPLSITFGHDYGYCCVDLGDTKVMAQVAAEVDHPKESRPSEGKLQIHLEISGLAGPSYDPTKTGALGVQVHQFLDRSINMSRAMDKEELCLRTNEKVWSIHLHVHVLCHDGNILDCAGIAAICALKHFKVPAVTFEGQDVIIHSLEEKNPLPLTLHHMPFCVSFAFFKEGEYLLIDPISAEEKVMDGSLMISMNKHHEVCCMQMNGSVQINKDQIVRCTNIAALKVKFITQFVLKALEIDGQNRKSKRLPHAPIVASDVMPGSKAHVKIKKEKIELNRDNVQSDTVNKGDNGDSLTAVDVKTEIFDDDEDDNTNKNANPWFVESAASVGKDVGGGVVNQWSSGEEENNTDKQSQNPPIKKEESSDEETVTAVLKQSDIGVFAS